MMVSILLSLHTAMDDIKEVSCFSIAFEDIFPSMVYVVFSVRTLLVLKTFRETKQKDEKEKLAWWRYALATLVNLPFFLLGIIFLSDGIFTLFIFAIFIAVVSCTILLSKWRNYRLSVFKRGERLRKKK
jgi:undecaprenyl pyrophosphate phosphatase UppP